MEIPRFWAEHREHRTLPPRRQVTLRRFGWSSTSQDEAQRHAEQRVATAWSDWDAGRAPTRREARVAYNGADGLPIREEIVAEHAAGAVETRNGYGARCLNVPDILFADIDLGTSRASRDRVRGLLLGIAMLVASAVLAVAIRGPSHAAYAVAGLALGIAALLALWRIPLALRRWRRAHEPELALPPLRRWCADHPDWRVRVYRTPAGLRLLATHAPIDPCGAGSADFFDHVATDPKYRLMCRKQACFRARVSPKPWRIDIDARIGWGTWPVTKVDAVQRRAAWIATYEQASQGFAACAFLEELGTGVESERGRAVREVHDRLCGIGSGLPLA